MLTNIVKDKVYTILSKYTGSIICQDVIDNIKSDLNKLLCELDIEYEYEVATFLSNEKYIDIVNACSKEKLLDNSIRAELKVQPDL